MCNMVPVLREQKWVRGGFSSQGVYSLVGGYKLKKKNEIFEFRYFLLLYFLRLNWLKPKEKGRGAYENTPCA